MPTRARTSLLVLLLAVLLLLPLSLAWAEMPNGKPNIVLIMADDMGFSDLGCYGGEVQTPCLDGLAKKGLRFTQFYNNAKCTTTRASLLTGLYPRPKGSLLKPNMVTIADVLGQVGYQTALSGKWHLGNKEPNRPSDRGFDQYYGLLDGCCNFFDPSQPDPPFKGGKVRFFAQDDERITEFPEDFYMTDAITDYAVQSIQAFSEQELPFFVHVCYTAPHYPLHARPEDIAKYRGKYMQGWEALRKSRHQRQVELGVIDPAWKLPGPDPEVKGWKSREDQEWDDLRMAVYAAMIDRMDQGIQQIVETLEETGQLKNTVIMFLSDNGGCAELPGGEDPSRIPGVKDDYTTCGPGWAWAQNTPFRRYKSWAHEGGISTPLIVYWEGVIEPNTLTPQVGHIIDLLPTCAEIAGADYPETFRGENILPVEGTSLVPIFQGKTRPAPELLFWEWSGNRAVRAGDWKLCWENRHKKWELYNLKEDRTETNNLADQHPDKVNQLSAQWYDWARKTGHNAPELSSAK